MDYEYEREVTEIAKRILLTSINHRIKPSLVIDDIITDMAILVNRTIREMD